MVLAELGGQISSAIKKLCDATILEDKDVVVCINEITRALLQADIQFALVQVMAKKIKDSVRNVAAGHNKRNIIQKTIFNELCNLVDPGTPAFSPCKGKTNLIMFVGLQGSGKTTSCVKYAAHYQKKGFKASLVCADTFRAGAFDQLKQNCTKVNIPYYGSYNDTDPVKVAQEGVQAFIRAKRDLIIVDTSGRHRQEGALFEEMRQLASSLKPDLIVLVMDGSIGQAAAEQANSFKQSAAVGAVIITKMDGHARGGGALSAVAATKSPVIFLGTGEREYDFEVFESTSFVKRLLGLGDVSGLVDKIKDFAPREDQLMLLKEGQMSLRLMYQQLEQITSFGSLEQIMSMIPGMNSNLNLKKVSSQQNENVNMAAKLKTIMNSMNDEELDSTDAKIFSESRICRISRGCGKNPDEVKDVLNRYKFMSKQMKTLLQKSKSTRQAQNLQGQVQHLLGQIKV